MSGTAPGIAREPLPNLPTPLSRFIGREQELSQLRRLAQDSRLLTLTGGGGCGKSRLALELARQISDRFPDGAWFIDLAPITGPDLVARAVLVRLGLAEQGRKPIMETLIRRLRRARSLLVLDTCEHVTDSAAALVLQLLEACAQVSVLATSRQPLRVPGELTWSVPPLALPQPEQVRTSTIARAEAVRLFTDRAALVRPEFELNADNARVVASICRRLDGIPLAIELSAARMRVLGEAEILARLQQRLEFLTGGSPLTHHRHQTLRATLDWSYELLTDAERTLFRQLSVFAGRFTLEHVRAICSGGQLQDDVITDLCTGLVDKSLVEVGFRGDGATRYRLLDTSREYAAQRLAEHGEERTARQRHADYFRGLAEAAEKDLGGPLQAAWLDRLDDDYDDVRAALEWAWVSDHGALCRLAGALGGFWEIRGHLSEGAEWVKRALDTDAGRGGVRSKLLASAGLIAWRRGDFATALPAMAEAVSIARVSGDRIALGQRLELQAFILVGAMEFEAADPVVAEALRVAREIGDPMLVGGVEHTAGVLALHLGKLETAFPLLRRSLEAARSMGDQVSIGTASNILGWAELRAGNLVSARQYLCEALQVRLAVDDRTAIAVCLDYFAELLQAEGHSETAMRLIGAADRIYQDFGAVPPSLALASRGYWLDRTSSVLGARARRALQQGGRMSVQEAVALTDHPAQEPFRQLAAAPAAELTRREREIASLVAAGLTNREIARRLALSERTIDAHVEHIRNKLDIRSRAQIGAWVADKIGTGA